MPDSWELPASGCSAYCSLRCAALLPLANPCAPLHAQGDFYYLSRMDPADKDVAGNLLNKDRAFGTPYKVSACLLGARWRGGGQRGMRHTA